ncbi:MAG: divalent-cation tolerance protein CutA [Nitrospiraceae bacterium]
MPRSAASDAALVVFVTASSYEEANNLSSLVVERKLAACATIVENVRSLFRWEGKVNSEKESLLILKTTAGRFVDLEKLVKKHHSYEVPEIIAFPIVMGSEDYLKWIRQETQK